MIAFGPFVVLYHLISSPLWYLCLPEIAKVCYSDRTLACGTLRVVQSGLPVSNLTILI